MDVTMLLCDACQESGGKLFILGGGWSVIQVANIPVPMALAIKMSIPWDRANHKHRVRAALLTEDGAPVQPAGTEVPVMAQGEVEVGRPPGMKPGTPIDAPIVLNFGALALGAGGYVWSFEVDDKVVARAPFRVLGQP